LAPRPSPPLFPYTTLFRSEAAIAPRDVVAAQYDEIRPLAHQHVDRVRDILVRHPLAAMDVREHPDAKAGEGRRKTIDAQRHASRSEEHTSELQSRGHLVCR